MKQNLVLAIVGMPGSGKGSVVAYLERRGWPSVRFGAIVYDEIKRRGLDIVKDEKAVNKDLRDKEGPLVLAKRVAKQVEALLAVNHRVVVLDGLYSWSELKYFQKKYSQRLVVIAAVANRQIRYERASSRRDGERIYTPADVMARDIHEIENLEKGGPIVYADYYIQNNSSLSSLERQIKNVLKDLGLST